MLSAPPSDVRRSLTAAVREALGRIGVEAPAEIGLEQPARREHGDWSTNAALASAKAARRPPRELASALADELRAASVPHVTAVEIAGPGFLNFRLADTWLHDVLLDVVAHGAAFAASDIGGGRRVVLEYVSANPTGPLHAGHARWAAYGDALARVMTHAGYRVHREFYVNDRGVQIANYAASLVARRDGLALPDDGYHGEYVREWAAEMPADADPVEWGLDKAYRYQRDTMARMHVEFDTWSSERAIAGRGDVERTLGELRERRHVFELDGATWLRTTDFGDDKDRVLIKADGTYTYFTPDIAYHRDKFARGDLLLNVWGADHHGYVARMKAAMQCLGHDAADVEIRIGQNVTLLRAGEEVRMSKRSGDIIELADIIDEVGADAAKLTFLLQSIDTRQTFDLAVVASSSMDNPVHYIHYAHARVHGIARRAAELGIVRSPLADADLSLLVHPRELDVLRVLSDVREVVALAALERAPHKVTTWVRELAAAFQSMYHDCPILRSDVPEPLRQARLWLVEAARVGLATGLDLLGVSAPERMDRLDDSADPGDGGDDAVSAADDAVSAAGVA